jgi:tripartite-type tricarboxylate transporter receptor subunit TctC
VRIAFAVGAMVAATAPAAADDFPSRTIRMVVGFPAGGPTDIPARYLADRLATALGKAVVVENKPGAAAQIAANDVLSRPANGYDLLVCTYFDAVNTQLYRSVKYKLSDLIGITLIARYSYAVAVANSLPVNDFKGLIAYAKAHPDVVNYGHLGLGSTQNILAKRLEKLTGMKMTPIPYKGSPDATQAIVAGQNHIYVAPPLGVISLYQSKQIKVLASTGDERLTSMPEVPTLREMGIPLVAYAWLGICARSGTPQPIIERINKEVAKIVNTPGYRDLLEKSGSVAVSSTPAELQKVILETADDVGPIIREFNLQLD